MMPDVTPSRGDTVTSSHEVTPSLRHRVASSRERMASLRRRRKPGQHIVNGIRIAASEVDALREKG